MEQIDIPLEDEPRLAALRARARRAGYRVHKSRWRHHTIDNWGGLQLIGDRNIVVAGDRFTLTVAEAEEALEREMA